MGQERLGRQMSFANVEGTGGGVAAVSHSPSRRALAATAAAVLFSGLLLSYALLASPGVGASNIDRIAQVNVAWGGSSLTVTWSSVSAATGYDVEYLASYDPFCRHGYEPCGRKNYFYTRAATDRTGTSLTINGIDTSAHGFDVRVRPKQGGVAGRWTNSGVVFASAPHPPAVVTATRSGNGFVISWTAPPGATHYDVLAGNARRSDITTLSVTLSDSEIGGGNTVIVRAKFSANASSTSRWSGTVYLRGAPTSSSSPGSSPPASGGDSQTPAGPQSPGVQSLEPEPLLPDVDPDYIKPPSERSDPDMQPPTARECIDGYACL